MDFFVNVSCIEHKGNGKREMKRQFAMAGIGEVLFDVLPDGERLGGAPINFAYQVNALGGHGIAVSTVGSDQRGQRALRELRANGFDMATISIDREHPTGYVMAQVNDMGVPAYFFPDDVAWDHLSLTDAARTVAPTLDCVCFGTLAQRSPAARAAILAFIRIVPGGALKIYDLNLRQNFYSAKLIEASLFLADILKLNDEELLILASLFGLSGDDEEMLAALADRFSLELSILTRGAKGALLLGKEQRVEHSGHPVALEDTIGAGDAFTAAVALGWLLGHPLPDIADHASRLAAYVCSQKGAMPPIPDTLKLI
jgi:fructokinase